MLRNHPDETNTFVGRTEELDRLAGALRHDRLVTVVGGPGTGKSRLALHAVSGEASHGFSGVCWADLWPLQGDELLAAVVADALDLSDHTPRMMADVLCAWVGDRRLLIVLDSCEHLTAACRDLVAVLLAACPRLTVLATSREPLDLPGEVLVDIGPLDPATDALTLFEDRAARAGRPLRGAEDRLFATFVCDRLEGVPLALELAAAQLSHHSLEETATRIRAGLDLPDQPDLRPLRHRALRTAVGWSHELCHPVERLLWARLAVFPGPFDAELAVEVCAGGPLTPDDARDALAGLVHRSVVVRDRDAYRMLDTVRAYGRMWLRNLDEETAVEARHAAAILELTRRARREWLGPSQSYWYARMRDLYHDVCAAVSFLLGSDDPAALEMAGNVAFFWVCCGHLHEAMYYVELALEHADDEDPHRARALWSLGLARILQGDHPEGRALAAESLRAASALGDREGVRQATYLEGLAALLDARPILALHRADDALSGVPAPRTEDDARAEAARSAPTFGTMLCQLVRIFALTSSGHLEQAREDAEALRGTCLRLGEYWTRSYLDYQLALIALFQDRTRAAGAHARNMLDAKRRIGDQFGIAMGLDLLAASCAEQGEVERAATAFGASVEYWRAVGLLQRGTPEVEPLRRQTEATVRAKLGDSAYEAMLRHTEGVAPEALLLSALGDKHDA
ncbi:ATP-binding protein [Streptomyces sp. YJ-C3]